MSGCDLKFLTQRGVDDHAPSFRLMCMTCAMELQKYGPGLVNADRVLLDMKHHLEEPRPRWSVRRPGVYKKQPDA